MSVLHNYWSIRHVNLCMRTFTFILQTLFLSISCAERRPMWLVCLLHSYNPMYKCVWSHVHPIYEQPLRKIIMKCFVSWGSRIWRLSRLYDECPLSRWSYERRPLFVFPFPPPIRLSVPVRCHLRARHVPFISRIAPTFRFPPISPPFISPITICFCFSWISSSRSLIASHVRIKTLSSHL